MTPGAIQQLFQSLESVLNSLETRSLSIGNLPVIIYGAGSVGRDVFDVLTRRGIPVVSFLDRQAQPGMAWHGVPVRQPDDPAPPLETRKNHQVVVAIFNAYVEIPPIVATLKSLGYTNVTTFLELYDCFGAELGDRFWLTAKSFYAGLEPIIAAGYDLWADDTSRALYASILRFRFTNEYGILSKPDLERQYFPLDISRWPSPLRFVDCGAYDGDTLARLIAAGSPVEAIAAFEPDQANFVKLAKFVEANRLALPDTVCLFPCGVHSCTEQLRFSAGHGSGSHPSPTGDAVIQCVSLDEAIPKFSPNLVKMDVEGAEYQALWGARQIIAEYQPGLAICLYHRPEHLWQIPLLVRQLAGRGRMYLRVHCFNGFELVMYRVPN